ncbi:opacity protein [Chryseobacterium glaciei]|uniref:Opacity protein n=1 Tax=Chryseobacterium glaciei TaxID=1685010 RepID=A0A172Y0M7_9FLAO|nr:porin family protein [Chryseobacterium glaciei]ANF52672.1 opacity protein [Chryseobacterium glaciei]
MKKLILGIAITASSLALAQKAASKSPVTFGVKAGMNVSSISKTEGIDQKAKVGFNAGAFANIPLSSQFSIQPELLYSGLGSKSVNAYEYSLAGVTTKRKDTYTTSLNYITVPVMFQYNALPNLYLEAGPEFGFMLSGKNKGDVTTTVTSGGNTSTATKSYSDKINKDNVNSFNLGLGIGAGYYFTPNIGVSARYVAGLTDINKKSGSGDAIKNNVFQVGVTYKFK